MRITKNNIGIKVILLRSTKNNIYEKKKNVTSGESPRIIYHEIKLFMKSGSTLQSALTTSYALHSLEPTKALFESEIKTN